MTQSPIFPGDVRLAIKVINDVSDNDYGVLEFYGFLDQSTIEEAEKQMSIFFSKNDCKYVIFDFTNLNFINSEGVCFLATSEKSLKEKNKHLIVCSANSHVKEIMNLIGISEMITICNSIQEAIIFIKKHKEGSLV